MAKSSKGGKYERELCKQLSLWWTNNERDDVFWRTSGSGARATTRAKSNKHTFGSHGDIAYIDPIGKPLLDVITIEAKRGYSIKSIIDLLDHSESAAEQQYETWINKAIRDSTRAGSPYWVIITRRDQRVGLVFMPWSLANALGLTSHFTQLDMTFTLRDQQLHQMCRVFGLHLDDFLKSVTPDKIKQLSKER